MARARLRRKASGNDDQVKREADERYNIELCNFSCQHGRGTHCLYGHWRPLGVRCRNRRHTPIGRDHWARGLLPIPTRLHDIRAVDATTIDRNDVLRMIQDALAIQSIEKRN